MGVLGFLDIRLGFRDWGFGLGWVWVGLGVWGLDCTAAALRQPGVHHVCEMNMSNCLVIF